MDDRREAVLRVRLDPLPHVQHRAAGRVDEHAAHGPQPLEVLYRDAEGGQKDDVAGRDRAEIEVPGLRPVEELHPHAVQLPVDVRIVDDLADQEDPLVGELGAGLVGVLDGAIHPIAEPELAGQLEGEVAQRQRVSVPADPVDHAAVVVGRERTLDVVSEAEAPPEVGLLHETNLHGHGCIPHGTASAPSGTAANAASTVTRPAAASSSPEPRACAEITPPPSRVTVTVPLSSGTPCATSVSPRCSTGQSPFGNESRWRSHTITPFPSLAPCNTTPPIPAASQRSALAGTSNRTVSLGGRMTTARTPPEAAGARPHAAPAAPSARRARSRGSGKRFRRTGASVPRLETPPRARHAPRRRTGCAGRARPRAPRATAAA